MKNKKGMTFIEILAVVAIISILFILLIPSVSTAFEKARISGTQNDLHSYEVAGKNYFMRSLGKEKSEDGFNEYLDKELQFTNGTSKKISPWKTPYLLVVSEDKKSLTVSTKSYHKEAKEYSLTISINSDGEIDSKMSDSETSDSESPESSNPDTGNTEINTCNQNATDESYFTVVDANGGVSITDYSSSGPKYVVIPCKIGGKDVVDISGVEDKGAFNSKSIASVVLPNTLKTISGDYAFAGNQLTSITFPDSLTSIGYFAFAFNNITSIDIPDHITNIESGAFYQNKLSTVKIPNKLTVINGSVFSYNNLTSVSISNSVTEIKNSAFAYNNITQLTIPSNVKTIGTFSFLQNDITQLTIPEGVQTIDAYSFENNKINNLVISDSVTFIGSHSFRNNLLTSITIPKGVTGIGNDAFFENIHLKTVINKSSLSNSDLEKYFDSSPTITK